MLEAHAELRKTFGSDALISLVLFRDPNEPSVRQLFLLVSVSVVEDALDRIAEFDARWWLRNRGRAVGQLSIDIEVA